MADEPPGKADSPFGASPGKFAFWPNTYYANRLLPFKPVLRQEVAAPRMRFRALPEWLDPEGEWPTSDHAPERQKWSHFGIDFELFWGIIRPKRLKRGQNRPVTVTYQLTMYFCIIFILCDLRYFYR
jgi:hypothetical protein